MDESVDNSINLLKLCVGAERVEDLLAWHRTHPSPFPTGERRHVTRMWPKRSDALLNGGSLYWVIKGVVLARQKILRLDEVDQGDGIRRCGLILHPDVIRTEAQPRRAFQGWRYLAAQDAPRDLSQARASEDFLPPQLMAALADIGVR